MVAPHIRFDRLSEQFVVLDTDSGAVHRLDGVSASVVAQIAEGSFNDGSRRDGERQALIVLEGLGIIMRVGDRDHTGINRRQALIGAAAAATVGVVTLALPSAAAAASNDGGDTGVQSTPAPGIFEFKRRQDFEAGTDFNDTALFSAPGSQNGNTFVRWDSGGLVNPEKYDLEYASTYYDPPLGNEVKATFGQWTLLTSSEGIEFGDSDSYTFTASYLTFTASGSIPGGLGAGPIVVTYNY